MRAEDGSPAVQPTRVRLCHDDRGLHVRFDCRDADVWATYRRRDEPLHEEEVVELFLAPGSEVPREYFEFQVNPLGALFDARIENPHSRRSDMRALVDWDCAGIEWAAGLDGPAGEWWAELHLPWEPLVGSGQRPATWRANLYRIERPRGRQPEFSCWSPTLVSPPDFHKPERFGYLELQR